MIFKIRHWTVIILKNKWIFHVVLAQWIFYYFSAKKNLRLNVLGRFPIIKRREKKKQFFETKLFLAIFPRLYKINMLAIFSRNIFFEIATIFFNIILPYYPYSILFIFRWFCDFFARSNGTTQRDQISSSVNESFVISQVSPIAL